MNDSRFNLHRVDGPDDEGEATNGSEEVANLATLGGGRVAAVDDELPDNNEVGNAGNGVPAPLLGGLLRAEGGKETGEDHDDVGNNGNQDVGTGKTSEQRKVEEQERGGDGPVDVASPVDLAVDVVLGGGNVLVVLLLLGVVPANAVAAGHCEVGQGGEGHDEGGEDVIETLGLGCVSALNSRFFCGLNALTVGTFQARPEKTTVATVMTTKTTLRSVLAGVDGSFRGAVAGRGAALMVVSSIARAQRAMGKSGIHQAMLPRTSLGAAIDLAE